MNLRIITKNHEVDLEIGFLKKSISKPYGRATAMTTAWELIELSLLVIMWFQHNFHSRKNERLEFIFLNGLLSLKFNNENN